MSDPSRLAPTPGQAERAAAALGRCWPTRLVSSQRHPPFQGSALPSELRVEKACFINRLRNRRLAKSSSKYSAACLGALRTRCRAQNDQLEPTKAQHLFEMLEPPVGVEPTTSCLQGRCSGRLSYEGSCSCSERLGGQDRGAAVDTAAPAPNRWCTVRGSNPSVQVESLVTSPEVERCAYGCRHWTRTSLIPD